MPIKNVVIMEARMKPSKERNAEKIPKKMTKEKTRTVLIAPKY
jgi:hypothetical protein